MRVALWTVTRKKFNLFPLHKYRKVLRNGLERDLKISSGIEACKQTGIYGNFRYTIIGGVRVGCVRPRTCWINHVWSTHKQLSIRLPGNYRLSRPVQRHSNQVDNSFPYHYLTYMILDGGSIHNCDWVCPIIVVGFSIILQLDHHFHALQHSRLIKNIGKRLSNGFFDISDIVFSNLP